MLTIVIYTNLFHQVARSAKRWHAGKFTVQRACVTGVAGRFLYGEARDVDGAVNEERVDFRRPSVMLVVK